MFRFLFCLLSTFVFLNALFAEPSTYYIQNAHTFPAFEADHQGGLSIWRGKVNRTSGIIVFDKENQTGDIEVEIDMREIDFGWGPMNDRFISDVYKTKEFPVAYYKATLTDFVNGEPTSAAAPPRTSKGSQSPSTGPGS